MVKNGEVLEQSWLVNLAPDGQVAELQVSPQLMHRLLENCPQPLSEHPCQSYCPLMARYKRETCSPYIGSLRKKPISSSVVNDRPVLAIIIFSLNVLP